MMAAAMARSASVLIEELTEEPMELVPMTSSLAVGKALARASKTASERLCSVWILRISRSLPLEARRVW